MTSFATDATDLLGKLVSVYERHYTYEGERWLCSGWVRSAEIGDGSISLILERAGGDGYVADIKSGHDTKAGDLWAVSSKNHPGALRFTLTDHPASVTYSDALRGTPYHYTWLCALCGHARGDHEYLQAVREERGICGAYKPTPVRP